MSIRRESSKSLGKMGCAHRVVTSGQFRLGLIGRQITNVEFQSDEGGGSWTILMLDNGQAVHIMDETPWVWVDPEVM